MVETLERRALFAFGVTATSTTFVIDNGGDLKFTVLNNGAATSSTIHRGDITSIKFKNQEMLASYAVTSRYSHYEQGLGGTSNISYTITNVGGTNVILVTCDDSAAASGAVIHYYAVRQNDNNIYMASLPIDVNNGPGEGRYIAYLDRNVFSNPEDPSDLAGNTGAIEGSDVYGFADGTTASKFYNVGGRRQIEHVYHGLAGTSNGVNVGAWMFMGSREHSAGGPFFKDIDFQSGSAVEIYNCIFTGHTQTESYRQGLHVYSLQFTDGAAPVEPSYSWMEALNLQGWIPAAQRGAVNGTVSGIAAGHEVTVGLSNASEQYWDIADAGGNYSIPAVHTGTYTQSLYDGELEVGRKTITVTAGATTNSNITSSFYLPSNPIFRIGTWDGTPLGFLNADKIEIMHPSDVRMSSWTSTPSFVVGTSTDAQWPMVQWKDINNSQRITFNLTAAQVQNLTLRIGITLDAEGGRNKITVNAGQSYAWTSGNPTASHDLNSRGLTRGTWRGDNQIYTFPIPSSAFRAGTNTIDLPVISGTTSTSWLSPAVVYDAIDLVPTTSASTPAIATVTITPANSTVAPSGAQAFTAVARDAAGNIVPANINWSATRGVIDPNGNYIAPATAGSDTITATATRTRTEGYSTGTGSSSTITDTVSATGSTNINVVAPVDISGTVFDDLDADGLLALGEPTLSGVTVYLDLNNNTTLDAGETFTTSGGGGAYAFSNLAAGTYTIREIAPANYASMNSASVSASASGVNLANARIVYNGTSSADTYLIRKNASGQFELYIGGSLTYTLAAGIPSLTFNLAGGTDTLTIDCAAGTPIPAGGVTFDGGDAADVLNLIGTSGAFSDSMNANSITFHGGTINHANLESVRFDAMGGSDNVTINGGPIVLFPTAQKFPSLTITSPGSATLAAGAGTLFCDTLSIGGGGLLDLKDNDLVVNSGDFNTIKSWVATGLSHTSGITSSTSDGSEILAVFDNSYVGMTGWNGATISPSAIVGKYTYYGDVNFDGQVTGDDYTVIDSNLGTTPPPGKAWMNGDANVDGTITGDDYTVVDGRLGSGAGNPLTMMSAPSSPQPLRLRDEDVLQ